MEGNPGDPVTSVEIVTGSARLRELGDQWSALWGRGEGVGLFQSFEYCRDAWELVEEPAGQSLACAVGWRGAEMVAVWPFVTRRNRLWTYARHLAASGVEMHELLIDPTVDRGAWMQQAWRALVDDAGVDVVEFSFFEEGPSAADFQALPVREPRTRADVSVYVDLSGEPDWDAYYESLSKSHRTNVARSGRRLAKRGAIEFDVVEAGDERTGRLIDWTLAQKRLWAEQTGKKGGWLYSDHYRDFLVRQLSDPEQSARNVALVLTLDGEPLATQLGAVGKGRYEYVIGGFDAEHQKDKPGALLNEAAFRWAWEQGLDCDLGAGGDRYKTFWSRGQEVPVLHRRAAVTRWGAVALRLRRAVEHWHDRRADVSSGQAGESSPQPGQEDAA